MAWNSAPVAGAVAVSSSDDVKYLCPHNLRPEGAASPDHVDVPASEHLGMLSIKGKKKSDKSLPVPFAPVPLLTQKFYSLDSHLTETTVETESEKQSSIRPILAYLNATIK